MFDLAQDLYFFTPSFLISSTSDKCIISKLENSFKKASFSLLKLLKNKSFPGKSCIYFTISFSKAILYNDGSTRYLFLYLVNPETSTSESKNTIQFSSNFCPFFINAFNPLHPLPVSPSFSPCKKFKRLLTFVFDINCFK